MAGPINTQSLMTPAPVLSNRANHSLKNLEASDIGKRFEQMLWAEMLSHAGLEKAFAQGGGEAASSFSRFVVEAVAKDLAETTPLGLADEIEVNVAARAASAYPGTDT